MATEWSDWYTREDPTTWVLPQILRRRAEEHPDRDYLKFADQPWLSYGEVNAQANRIANALLERGVAKGESVSVMLPNCAEFLPIWYGILKAGAVMSSINTAYKGDPPHIVALIDLDEGVRMMSNLVRDEEGFPSLAPEEVSIGMRVRVVFHDVTDEITLPKFAPA